MTEPSVPGSPAAISVRTGPAEKLGAVSASFRGDSRRQRKTMLLAAVFAGGIGLVFASAIASPPLDAIKIACAIFGAVMFAVGGVAGLLAGIFADVRLEVRQLGVVFSRVRGPGIVIPYDSIQAATFHEGWHRRAKRRTRWITIRSSESLTASEIAAFEFEDFDAILAELRKNVALEPAK